MQTLNVSEFVLNNKDLGQTIIDVAHVLVCTTTPGVHCASIFLDTPRALWTLYPCGLALANLDSSKGPQTVE